MSEIPEYRYEFVDFDKSIGVSKSEGKVSFNLTHFELDKGSNQQENNVLSSEKIEIPGGIDAYWMVKLELKEHGKDVKQWSCELFVNDDELISSNEYKVQFRRLKRGQFTYGNHPSSSSILIPINNKHIIGITSTGLGESSSYYHEYRFHFRIAILHRRNPRTVIPLHRMKTSPCWMTGAQSLIKSKNSSDFTYVVQGKEFKVHKAILSLASPVFRSTFECGLDESKDNSARIDDCDPELFRNFLNVIYTGTTLPKNIHDISLELYKLAHVYQVASLQDMCSSHLMDVPLDENNVFEFYEAATLYDLDQLKSECWNFIKWKMMKIHTPLEGEPYSVEDVREILDEINRTNLKQKEMRDEIAKKQKIQDDQQKEENSA